MSGRATWSSADPSREVAIETAEQLMGQPWDKMEAMGAEIIELDARVLDDFASRLAADSGTHPAT